MKGAALALLFAAAALFPRPAPAWFGWESANEPAARGGRIAVLWVPDMAALDWESLKLFFDTAENARLTIALDPSLVPEDARPWLIELIEKGRLEPALRLAGDPILPLLPSAELSTIVRAAAAGRSAFRNVFEAFPAGFVPGAGALSAGIAAPLGSQGFQWASVGDAEFQKPWSGGKDFSIVPFHAPIPEAPLAKIRDGETRLIVIDETGPEGAPGRGLSRVERMFRESGDGEWTTVSAAIRDTLPYAVGPESWPLWRGDLASWSAGPLQKKAWSLFVRAAVAVRAYQNSGAANLRTLDRAQAALLTAARSGYFLPGRLKDPVVDRDFRSKIARVHRLIGEPSPKETRAPLGAGEPGAPVPGDEDGLEFGVEDSLVRRGRSDDGIWFENPPGSTAGLPAVLTGLPPGTTAADLWTPQRLHISWDEAAVTFLVTLKRLIASDAASEGFSRVMVDLYMDLNHLNRRGSLRLLPGRDGFIASRDGWEYAIVLSGAGAGLFRSVPGHPAALVERLEVSADIEAGELQVRVPRGRLPGLPAGWGYLLVTMGVEKTLASADFPRPAPGASGNPILGLLGDLPDQKQVTGGSPAAAYGRFSALRIDATN